MVTHNTREFERVRGLHIEDWLLSSWMDYTHQMTWLQYPVVTAKEMRMRVGMNNSGAFRTIQDALQFYPYESTDSTMDQTDVPISSGN